MKIKELKLMNFRNYEELEMSFNKNIICFTGLNGQGKTNIVEAVGILGTLGSFRTNNYSDLVKFNSPGFFIKGDFYDKNGNKKDVQISYDGKNKKIIYRNKKVNRFSDFWGNIPVVYLIPDESEITTGPPGNRREFLDKFISMNDKEYFSVLKNYIRIIKQKNNVLFSNEIDIKEKLSMLGIYNKKIVEYSTLIFHKRVEFLKEFKNFFKDILNFISDLQYDGDMEYSTVIENDYKNSLEKKLVSNINEEIRRGTSLYGAHKDDIVFSVNSKDLRKFGSQGQHKLYLVALKLSQIEYLKSKTDEYPVFILDDLYSEIDEMKSLKIAEILDSDIQTFITTTNNSIISQFDKNNTELYKVHNAGCEKVY